MKHEEKAKITVEALKTKGPLLCSTGTENAYRKAFYQGLGASRKENTFDRSLSKRGGHSCCGSRVNWRHKINCPRATGFGNL